MRQLKLFSESTQTQYGGSLLKGRRKSKRPLSLKSSHHLVLKASSSADLLRNRTQASDILKRFGARFGVRIYAVAVHCDHIHVQILVSSREAYVKWIRAVTSVLVQNIQGLKFTLRPWTRIVAWGKAFRRVAAYIEHNLREADFLAATWARTDQCRQDFLHGLNFLSLGPRGPTNPGYYAAFVRDPDGHTIEAVSR